jgi:cobalt-precorrin-5B (C1)-methyltransferase
MEQRDAETALAGIVKDAGDDPDVTHGALVMARVTRAGAGSGIAYLAGEGVGTVTRPGLPLPPGEPAINPKPREMIAAAIGDVAQAHGVGADAIVEISIRDGAALARKTLNPRLGIIGGLSVLGTTGIVIPFSCAAWIHSIHRGIDVARAAGLSHIAAATGSTSEQAVAELYDLPEMALIDMGDFVGGTLKYLRSHPVERLTIAGGFAKMCKLGQGLLDLHSKRGAVDLTWLAGEAGGVGADEALRARIVAANSGLEALQLSQAVGIPIAERVAGSAQKVAAEVLREAPVKVDVAVFDRSGHVLASSRVL